MNLCSIHPRQITYIVFSCRFSRRSRIRRSKFVRMSYACRSFLQNKNKQKRRFLYFGIIFFRNFEQFRIEKVPILIGITISHAMSFLRRSHTDTRTIESAGKLQSRYDRPYILIRTARGNILIRVELGNDTFGGAPKRAAS